MLEAIQAPHLTPRTVGDKRFRFVSRHAWETVVRTYVCVHLQEVKSGLQKQVLSGVFAGHP